MNSSSLSEGHRHERRRSPPGSGDRRRGLPRPDLPVLPDPSQEADLTLPANCNGYGRVRPLSTGDRRGLACRTRCRSCPPAARSASLGTRANDRAASSNAACAWRCWYCFVPEELLRADRNAPHSVTAAELVDFSTNPDAPRSSTLGRIARPGAGWTLWMMRALTPT